MIKEDYISYVDTIVAKQIIEVEMVNYDLESLAIGLFADQTKSMDDGIYTLYDFDGNIYAQYDLYEIRDAVDKKLFEVRKRRTSIDTSKTLNRIVNNG